VVEFGIRYEDNNEDDDESNKGKQLGRRQPVSQDLAFHSYH
jgi:hypothetical protein